MKISSTIKKHGDAQIISWSDMPADSLGSVVDSSALIPRSVTFEGTFNGAVVTIEGSLGGEFFPLTSLSGHIAEAGSDGMRLLSRSSLKIMPVISDGTRGTRITVRILCDTIPRRRLGR